MTEELLVEVYLYTTREDTVVYAPNADVAQYLADRMYEKAGQLTHYVERCHTAITLNGVTYTPVKHLSRGEVPMGKRLLFVFTYEGMFDGFCYHPIYALHLEAAILSACEWINQRPHLIYVSVRKQPEGMEIDGVFYPGEEEIVSGE